jgi:hypothetical protein
MTTTNVSPADSTATIQAAIDTFNTVNFAAGVYILDAPLVINNQVNLLGAQVGVDARTGRPGALESILQPATTGVPGSLTSAPQFIVTGLIVVSDDAFVDAPAGITIDGFIIQNNTAIFTSYGIQTSANHSGYNIVNNIIQNNNVGILLSTSDDPAIPNVIGFNLIRNNGTPPPGYLGAGIVSLNGQGIYSVSSSVSNTLIESNLFTGQSSTNGSAINLENANNNIIRFNTLNLDSSIDLYSLIAASPEGIAGTNNNAILSNCILNSTGSAIVMAGGTSNTTISGNTVAGSTGAAVSINTSFGQPNQSITITGNNFIQNQAAASITTGSFTPTVAFPLIDARGNYYNSPAGPGGFNNLSTTGAGNPFGDKVFDRNNSAGPTPVAASIDISGFLTAPVTTVGCPNSCTDIIRACSCSGHHCFPKSATCCYPASFTSWIDRQISIGSGIQT